MFLRHKSSGDLVEILDLQAAYDPNVQTVAGRFHVGEEMPEPEDFDKAELEFPSGEGLPRCWVDPHYRDHP